MLDKQSSCRAVGYAGQQLEDSQASIIEQAIDLLYQHELQQTTNAQQSDVPESADMLE